MRLKYRVYVIISLKDKKLYVGYTTDLTERLTAHFKGQVGSTAPRRPFRLIYPSSPSQARGYDATGTEFHQSEVGRRALLWCPSRRYNGLLVIRPMPRPLLPTAL